MIRIQVGSNTPKEFDKEEIINFEKELNIINLGHQTYNVIQNHHSYEISIINIDYETKAMTISIDGAQTQVKCADKMDLLLEKMGIDNTISTKMSILKSPMPGLVIDWLVSEGQEVKIGDKLLILEAMKMENVIKSSGEGIVKKLNVAKGVAVEKNQVLIEFV